VLPWSEPACALLLRGFFAQSPQELEEAAMVDGCSRLGAFWWVTLPITLPGIVAVGLLGFITAWNNFLFPVILAKDASTQTAVVELSYMVSSSEFSGSTNWGGILAASTVITIPVVIIFAGLQRFLVRGLTAGSLKG
jgi:N,N'-diacetylchitobiose transport system permease protein